MTTLLWDDRFEMDALETDNCRVVFQRAGFEMGVAHTSRSAPRMVSSCPAGRPSDMRVRNGIGCADPSIEAQIEKASDVSGSAARIALPSSRTTRQPSASSATAARRCDERIAGWRRERRGHGRKGSSSTSTVSFFTSTLWGSIASMSSLALGRQMLSTPSGPDSLQSSGHRSTAWRVVGPSWQ